MSHPPFPFQIRPMQRADIPQVVSVEQAAYTMHWPQKAYEYELTNELARYFVLHLVPPRQPNIIGVAGFWLLFDEAHISTIAVHPLWRRRGLGEWLLIHIIEEAQQLGAVVATLEVRPSNRAALALYKKYDFAEVGRRPRYYSDNNEDALILTSPALATPEYQTLLNQHLVALQQSLAKIDVDKIA